MLHRKAVQGNHFVAAVNNEHAHGHGEKADEEKRHGFLPCVGSDLRLVDHLGYNISGGGQSSGDFVFQNRSVSSGGGLYQDFAVSVRLIQKSGHGGKRQKGCRSPRMAEEDCVIVCNICGLKRIAFIYPVFQSKTVRQDHQAAGEISDFLTIGQMGRIDFIQLR